MKTIQTFVLLILLFAARTFAQDAQDAIPSETENQSVITENPVTKSPPVVEPEVETQTVGNEELQTPLESSTKVNAEQVPKIQEGIENEQSSESPIETAQTEPQGTEAEATETDPSSDNIQNEEQTNTQGLEAQETVSIEPSSETPLDGNVVPQEPILNEPEEQISESPVRPASESPENIVQPVNEETQGAVLSESEQTVPQQEPEETITCICNCGSDSELSGMCEETNSETVNPVDEKESSVNSNSSDIPLVSNSNDTEGTLKPIESEAENSVSSSSNDKFPRETSESVPQTVPESSNQSSDSPESVAPSESASQSATETVPEPSNPPSTPEAATASAASESASESPSESPLESASESFPEPSDPSTDSPEATQVTLEPVEVPSTTPRPCTVAGNSADPTNCRKYLSCTQNGTNLISKDIQCPERSAFNPNLGRCTRDLSPCLDEEPVCLISSSIPNPNGDNSSYFWCVPNLSGGFHKYQIQCSENEIFYKWLGRCWPENLQDGLSLLGLYSLQPSDRDIVREENKLLRKEIKLKLKEEKLKKKLEEKAKQRAEKLAAKELKKQQEAAKKSVDSDEEED